MVECRSSADRDFQLFVCQEAFSLSHYFLLYGPVAVLRFNLGRNADSNRASSRASWPGACARPGIVELVRNHNGRGGGEGKAGEMVAPVELTASI